MPPHPLLDAATLDGIFKQKILPSIQAKYTGQSHNALEGFIIGGQPGAGKSVAIAEVIADFAPQKIKTWVLDVDEFREFHPNLAALRASNPHDWANLVHEDSARWMEMAIDEGLRQKVNVVIERTMGNSNTIRTLCGKLNAQKYEVNVLVVAVQPEVSWTNCLWRAERNRSNNVSFRYVPKDVHDQAVAGISETLDMIHKEKLCREILVQDSTGNSLFENTLLVTGEWEKPISAAATVQAAHQKPLTTTQYTHCLERSDAIILFIKKRHEKEGEIPHEIEAARDWHGKIKALPVEQPAEFGDFFEPDLEPIQEDELER